MNVLFIKSEEAPEAKIVDSMFEYIFEFPDWVELGKRILESEDKPLLVITFNEKLNENELTKLIIQHKPISCVFVYLVCDSSQQNIQTQKLMVKVAELLYQNGLDAIAVLETLNAM